MSISEKIKGISSKIEQNKAQYDLDKLQRFQLYHQRLLVNILFLTNEGVLPKKDSLQKAAAINRCEYSGFELTYRDSGSTNHFLIFTMQIFPPSQKITIPKCAVSCL